MTQGLAGIAAEMCNEKRTEVPALPPGLRAGYLGADTDHCANITRLFGAMGAVLPAVPDSASWGIYKKPPSGLSWQPAATVWRKATRLRNQGRGTAHKAYLAHVLELIDRQRLNCLIAYWGTSLLGDMIAIKAMRPKVKIVFNCLCHPLGIERLKVALQNWHFRRSVGCLDGIILPGEAMRTYLRENVLGRHRIPSLVWPPRYSRHFFPKARRERCPHQPNVLFLGRMDWYRAQPSDDVNAFLQQLLESGVHVYHHSARGFPDHPNRHTFKYMSLMEAEEFATAFDAALIMYNLDACAKTDRFDVTVPDRLLAGVTAGIPIALPAHGFAASREYLRDYGAVIEFASAEELARQLRNEPEMRRLRQAAELNSAAYMAEKHLQPLVDFLGQVVRE